MPPSKIKSLLQSLRSASEQINDESDALLDAIKNVEFAIGKFNIGLQAWVEIDSSSDSQGNEYSTDLGYCKAEDGKGWALHIGHTANGDVVDLTRLSDAKREEKVMAMEHLEKLLEQLVAEAQTKAKTISAARAVAEQIADQLGAKGSAKEDQVPF